MKFNYIVLTILFLTACASTDIKQPIPKLAKPQETLKPPINIDELELRDDSYYEIGVSIPFSGSAYGKFLFKNNNDFGTFSSGRIISGKKQGIWELRHITNGKIWDDYVTATLQYKDGKLNGQKTFYRTDGSIKGRESYKNGLQDGLSISFHDNDKLAYKALYKEGKRHGNESEYFDNGQLKYSSVYIEGELADNGESLMFYKNGQIHHKSTYKDGKKHGISITYYPNGNIQWKNNYQNDVQEGRLVGYYENATIKLMAEMRNDKRHGSAVNYREDGSIESRIHYENGKIVKANFYDYEGNLEFSK